MRKLVPSAEEACSWSDEDRIRFIYSSRYIPYTAAKMIMRRLDELREHPKIHRMPNLIIVGRPNNGKTALINRYKEMHKGTDDPNAPASDVPILVVQAPPGPDERRFYADVLDHLRIPYSQHDTPGRLQFRLRHVLPQLGTKMLVIDEIHNILAGPPIKQRRFMNEIKHLGNDLMIPLVVVGIKEALYAVQTDEQIDSRFPAMALPRWEFNKELLGLMASFESYLPLKEPSCLAEPEVARELFDVSGGIIGDISRLINEAAVMAISLGEEKISRRVLAKLDLSTPAREKEKVASVL